MPYQRLQAATITTTKTTVAAAAAEIAKARDRQHWQHLSARLMTKWLSNWMFLFGSFMLHIERIPLDTLTSNNTMKMHKEGKHSTFYWFGRLRVWHGMNSLSHCDSSSPIIKFILSILSSIILMTKKNTV